MTEATKKVCNKDSIFVRRNTQTLVRLSFPLPCAIVLKLSEKAPLGADTSVLAQSHLESLPQSSTWILVKFLFRMSREDEATTAPFHDVVYVGARSEN